METVDALYDSIVVTLLISDLKCVEVTKYIPELYNVTIGYKNIIYILTYGSNGICYYKCKTIDIYNQANYCEKTDIPGTMPDAVIAFIKLLSQ